MWCQKIHITILPLTSNFGEIFTFLEKWRSSRKFYESPIKDFLVNFNVYNINLTDKSPRDMVNCYISKCVIWSFYFFIKCSQHSLFSIWCESLEITGAGKEISCDSLSILRGFRNTCQSESLLPSVPSVGQSLSKVEVGANLVAILETNMKNTKFRAHFRF